MAVAALRKRQRATHEEAQRSDYADGPMGQPVLYNFAPPATAAPGFRGPGGSNIPGLRSVQVFRRGRKRRADYVNVATRWPFSGFRSPLMDVIEMNTADTTFVTFKEADKDVTRTPKDHTPDLGLHQRRDYKAMTTAYAGNGTWFDQMATFGCLTAFLKTPGEA